MKESSAPVASSAGRPSARWIVNQSLRTAWVVLRTVAVPLVVVLMVPLAIVAALCFYVAAAGHGFWLLCRAIPQWLAGMKDKTAPRKPHFLETPTPTRIED
jgi:hypothetical protein